MTEIERLEADLDFVRDAVRRSDDGRSVGTIHLLWALIVPIGFALMDFAPQYVAIYWTLAGPGGFVLSGFLGAHAARSRGQMSFGLARRETLHWGATLAIIFLAVPLVATDAIGQDEFGMFVVLFMAFSYFLAGVHGERTLQWVGFVLILGYVALWFVPAYRWTLIGALASAALIVTAFASGSATTAEPDDA